MFFGKQLSKTFINAVSTYSRHYVNFERPNHETDRPFNFVGFPVSVITAISAVVHAQLVGLGMEDLKNLCPYSKSSSNGNIDE